MPTSPRCPMRECPVRLGTLSLRSGLAAKPGSESVEALQPHSKHRCPTEYARPRRRRRGDMELRLLDTFSLVVQKKSLPCTQRAAHLTARVIAAAQQKCFGALSPSFLLGTDSRRCEGYLVLLTCARSSFSKFTTKNVWHRGDIRERWY